MRARLLKDIDAPLADLLASGGIPEGSDVLVAYTGERGRMGEELQFYFRPNPELANRGEEQRARMEQMRRDQKEKQGSAAPPMPRGPVMARTFDERGRR